MRVPGSPISIAYDDAILRCEGLASDTFGEAKKFFDLTDGELHAVLCYCHFGPTVSAVESARVLRRVVAQAGRSSLASWVRRIFVLG